MALSIFGDKSIVPNEEMLAQTLAGSKELWGNIEKHVASICGSVSGQWKFYSKKAGWSYVVKSGDRAILYLIPQDAFFKASFVFGEKAYETAKTSGLPEQIVALITEATPYAEGRSFMFDVKAAPDVDAAKKLIEIKHSN